MRATFLVLAILAVGCVSELASDLSEQAEETARQAWGADFDRGTYDLWRELSEQERRELDESIHRSVDARVHAGPRAFGYKLSSEGALAEMRKLERGCALAMSSSPKGESTWRRQQLVDYVVFVRAPDGSYRWVRLASLSHEDALERGRRLIAER